MSFFLPFLWLVSSLSFLSRRRWRWARLVGSRDLSLEPLPGYRTPSRLMRCRAWALAFSPQPWTWRERTDTGKWSRDHLCGNQGLSLLEPGIPLLPALHPPEVISHHYHYVIYYYIIVLLYYFICLHTFIISINYFIIYHYLLFILFILISFVFNFIFIFCIFIYIVFIFIV